MDRRLFLALAAGGLAGPAGAQDFGKAVGGLLGAGLGLPAGVTGAQAEGGLREALIAGAVSAVLRVGRPDGYWGDTKIRIPLPGVLGRTQRTLTKLGLSAPLDDLQRKVNISAEKAAPQARDMFTGAIRAMTVDDVVGVLRGGDTSATDYLNQKTTPQLIGLFRQPMASALTSTGALRSLDRAVTKNGLAGALGGNPTDILTNFAVTKALDGLFFYVGEEERAIRHMTR